MNTALNRLTAVLTTVALTSLLAMSLRAQGDSPVSKATTHFRFDPLPGQHFGRVNPEDAADVISPRASAAPIAASAIPPVRMAPTRSSFLATWPGTSGATGYRLDVSTSPFFDSFVEGYHNVDVGNVNSQVVSHLKSRTTYYYRVRPYSSAGVGTDSSTMTSSTAAESGLVISPTFDTTITSNVNAAAIEASINRAIALYQSLFTDPITINIRFRLANTDPTGAPLPDGTTAESFYVIYYVPWSTYIASLKADAKTTNDVSANNHLPSLPLTTNLVPSSAGGRAVGLNTPPAMFANGTLGDAGPYDGIVTLNSDVTFKYTRPAVSGDFDAQRAVEHEIDEVIGLGSYLGGSPEATDFRPQDLFAWSAPGHLSHAALGIRYFSIDDGITNIVDFSQVSGGDYGDWASEPCPQPHPYVQNAFGCAGQSYDISATSPEGINLDVVGYDLKAAILPQPTVLGNISTRGLVRTVDQVLIGGFIVTGNDPKPVIVRALGPSTGVTGSLADPVLELHDSDETVIASNDNWKSDQESAILSTGVAPTNELESAIVETLAPGAYTAIVSGKNGATGVGLVEVYDLDLTVDSKLANISTRGFVGTGDNVLIGGFIVLGDTSTSTLIRAIGPSLTALGVTGALQDPELELHDGNGTLIVSNDDWMTDQESEIIATGAAPTESAESAIVMTLAPGNYTAIVSGKSNTTGVGLVEVYQLDN
jgi:hypothetical protein